MSLTDDMDIIDVPGSPSRQSGKKDSAGKLTVLDQLKMEISKEVTRPEIEIAVPERPGVTVRFSPNITNERLKAWRRNCTNRKTEELDSIKFSCYIIGQTVTGIYFNDELVLDNDGNIITFASPVMMEMTGTDRPLPDAIRAFYGVDPHIENVALKILDYAGYGDDIDAENPTKG